MAFPLFTFANYIIRDRSDALIKLSDLPDVFKDDKDDYDKNAQKFLFELMQIYELAYKRIYHKGIVVPQCLPIDSPKPEELPVFPRENTLFVEISAFKSGSEQPRLSFPPDVLPRFIVRRSEDIENQRIWRFGAVLKKGNVTALIQQDHHLIQLKVKGEGKKAFYDELLHTLVDVLSDYKSFAEDKPDIKCALITQDKTSYTMVPLYEVNNIAQKMIDSNMDTVYDEFKQVSYSRENVMLYFNNCSFGGSFEMEKQTNKSKTKTIGDNNTVSTQQVNSTNDIDFAKLKELLNQLEKEVPAGASTEVKQQVGEIAESIESELKQAKPKKFTIKAMLDGLNGLVRTTEFAAALATIVQFIDGINF